MSEDNKSRTVRFQEVLKNQLSRIEKFGDESKLHNIDSCLQELIMMKMTWKNVSLENLIEFAKLRRLGSIAESLQYIINKNDEG